jgi:hypothetical protein
LFAAPRCISKELISHRMLKIKLLQENDFKSSPKSVTLTGLKNLFGGGSSVWAEMEAMGKNEV